MTILCIYSSSLEIFILALDPTDGLLSLGFAGFLASTRDMLIAAHSRSHESEADELGCKLAAMACFDTKKGIKAIYNMHTHDTKHGSQSKDLMSSHPPSIERYERLKELSESENTSKYSYCNSLRSQIGRALTLRTES